MIFGAIEHQTWAYLRGEGDFSVDASAAGITEIVYDGIAVRTDHAADDIGAAVARLERVARELTDGLRSMSRTRQG